MPNTREIKKINSGEMGRVRNHKLHQKMFMT
jgi:hypothetical protein